MSLILNQARNNVRYYFGSNILMKYAVRQLSSSSASIPPGRAKFNLESKVAVVTASTEGIGFAIAQRLAQSGAEVVVSSRKQKNVDEAVKKLNDDGLKNVTGITCHVGKNEDREKLRKFIVEKFGGLDILVSNAAVNPAIGHILDMEESVFDKIMDINVKSAFMLTKELMPHMVDRPGDKSIVYNSSIAAYSVLPGLSAYSIAKSALLALSRAVSLQCASDNIRVNCVCPGIIQTKFSDQLTTMDGFEEEFTKSLLIKRIGKPEEIASLVTFLCSEEASYITGESYVVAGGYYTRV